MHLNNTTVALNVEDNPCFWQLWMKFDDKMLRKSNETTPFIDLQTPLVSMKERIFYTCDWKLEYETLRSELAVLKHTHALSLIDEQVRQAQEALAFQLERRAACLSLLEEAKNKQ